MTRTSQQTQGPAASRQDDIAPPVIWAKLVLGHPDSSGEIPVYAPQDGAAGETDPIDEPPAPSPVAPSP